MAHVIKDLHPSKHFQERFHVYASRSGQFWRRDPGLVTEIANSYEAARRFLRVWKSDKFFGSDTSFAPPFEWYIVRVRHYEAIAPLQFIAPQQVAIAQSKGARF